MSGFADALAKRIETGTRDWSPTVDIAYQADDIADAVLAMPEMQALRRLARNDLENWCCDECRQAYLDEEIGYPQMVAWVLDGEQ